MLLPRPRLIAALLAPLLAGCGGGEAELATPPSGPSSTVMRPSGETQGCMAPTAGYRLRFPADWSVNEPTSPAPCRFFHPVPFDLPEQSEATGIAIAVQMESGLFAERVPSGDTRAATLVERREARVAGKRAARVETVSTGRALLPRGVRVLSYYVDFDSRTLVATTSEAAAAGTFDANVGVLDDMMANLTAIDSSRSCSAAGLPSGAAPGARLPTPVGATHSAIIRAAIACDYATLADIAAAGSRPFTYSFGQQGAPAPAEFWRQAEQRGEPALRMLVEILRLPYATRQVEDSTHFLWPSAFGFGRWRDVPVEDREALRGVYSEAELMQFEEFGAYVGRRVGIEDTGEWLFYVSGD